MRSKSRIKSIGTALCLGLYILLCACGAERTPEPTPGYEPVPGPELLPQVRISEVMGKNRTALALPDGSFPAWLELYNAGEENAELSGFSLRCGKKTWTLPELSLLPGEYRLVVCDGEGEASDGLLHSDLALGDGESLQLLSPRETELDSLTLPVWETDVSWRLGEDGSYGECRLPSPGYENTEAGYLAFQRDRGLPEEDLCIGEAMVYNEWYLPQDGAFFDWVEITNDTDRTLELSDYYLSDKGKDRLLFQLPARELAPGESIVVFCSDEGAPSGAAPFGLNAAGESLYLSRKDGTLCDYVRLQDIPYGCSMGRMPGEGGFFYFASPSPGKGNSGGVRFVGERPRALSPDGVFDGVDSVKVELAGAGSLRYTLDGSVPTEQSELYTGPFTLTKTGVVRAVSFQEDHLPSETLSLSYIVNEGHSLPVLSLVCDPQDLFGVSGIYSNPTEIWERPGCLMFYGEGESFRQDCGVKLHGATSRVAQNKKSFKLMFRDRYAGRLSYDLFGNGVTEFSSILLRAAQEADQSTLMRDNLMHQLSLQAFPELPAQDYRYAVLYLNGSYWGVYNIREAHSAAHYAQHYGYDEDTVSQWQAAWPADSVPEEVYQFAAQHDLKNDENYAYVSRYVNTESVIAWCVMQVYSGNFDFNSPNMRFYYSTQDQQLRYALVDLDLGMFDYGSFTDVFSFGYAYNYLAVYLMQNESFRRDFIRMTAEALAGPLSDDNALALIDGFAEELRPEIARDRERWGGTLREWERMVEHLREYIEFNQGRAKNVEELLRTSGFVRKGEMEEFFRD